MFKAIIFDVDGTLSETEETHRLAFNEAFAAAGLNWHWDQALYRRLLQVTGGKERIRFYLGQNQPAMPRCQDLDGFIRELHQTKTAIYTRMIAQGSAQLRPGIRELIDAARRNGTRLAIATTTSLPNVEALLQSAYGDAGQQLFEVICGGDSVSCKKPAPDIYALALRELDLAAADCVAIEDSRNGLLASTGAGIATVVTPSVYTDGQCFDAAALLTGDLVFADLGVLYRNLYEKTQQRRTA